jgi:N-acetyl-anhydromuramyl-L-alanine amidase AmpD
MSPMQALWKLVRVLRGGAWETGHPEPDLYIDEQGWLWGDGVERYPSVRHSPLTTPHDEPIAIVWHYTAIKPGAARSLSKRIAKYRRGKDRAASWHVQIGVDGTLYQSVQFTRGSWHCARGRIPDKGGKRHRVNRCAVGIELEGLGRAFPEPQVQAAIRLVKVLVERYDIPRQQAGRGHVEFDPRRRSDPGKVWARMQSGILDEVYLRPVPLRPDAA